MKFRFLRHGALVSCLALALFSTARAADQREYQVVDDAAWSTDSATSYDEIEKVQYVTGGGPVGGGRGVNLGLGNTITSHRCQVFGYADYIYARASSSENIAYVIADPNDIATGPTFVEHDCDYTSSYRFGGGISNVCGGAIIFNYANYRSTTAFSVDDTSSATTTTIFGQYEVDAPADGGNLSGDSEAEIQSYDVGFARTWPLCGVMPCGGCCDDCCGGCDDTCCDPCCGSGCDLGGCGSGCGCCKPCPAWDITWSAAVRFADVSWNRGAVATSATGTDIIDSFRTNMSFTGVGARTGLLGRRYIGQSRILSVYAKGDISLLVGDMDIATITTDDPDGSDTGPTVLPSHRASGCRVIPVSEIEAGVTTQLTSNCQFSAGYFLSAWHDLGFRDEYDWTVPGLQISHYDDANILGFDGFFARAVLAY